MKRLTLFFISVWLLFLSVPVLAAIPALINYQGKLTDSTGANVADAVYTIKFSIYDVASGGTALWSETVPIQVTKGVFNHTLGSDVTLPSNIFSGSDRWLGIKVNLDAEMSPRQRITSNAYNFNTLTADYSLNSDLLDSMNSTDYVNSGGDTITGSLNIEGYLTVGSNALFVDAFNNRVGIGTPTPSSELHIYEKTNNTVSLRIQNPDSGSFSEERIDFVNEDGTLAAIATYDNDNPSYPSQMKIFNNRPGGSLELRAGLTSVFLNDSGKVGIGTFPFYPLHVYSGGGDEVARFQGSSQPYITLAPGGSEGARIQTVSELSGGASLRLFTADPGLLGEVNERLRITQYGAVGIGTSSPSQRLHVYSSGTNVGIAVDGGSAGRARLGLLPGGVDNGELGFKNDLMIGTVSDASLVMNSEIVRITNSGNVGIGTSTPGNILTIVQNSTTDPVADSWATYSSADYKQDIRELSEEEYLKALEKLVNTPVVRYRYKGQTSSDKEKIGIVIEKAPEEIISEGNPKAASLSEYISLLHAGLKAQQLKIEELEEMVKLLKENK